MNDGSDSSAVSGTGSRPGVIDELRELYGRVGVADGILPPLLFAGVNTVWGLPAAAIVALGSALLIVTARLLRGKPLRFAVTGLVGTVLAVVLALRSGWAGDYFLPGILSGVITTLAIIGSLIIRRPFVAWSSWIARGWPLTWYWHPRVLPAYMKVTWLWAAFFAIRSSVQWWLYAEGETVVLGLVRIATGWPAFLALLIATYVLGRRRLTELAGPSVADYAAGTPEPWQGQPRGF